MDELKGKLTPTEESLSGSITSTTQEITETETIPAIFPV